MQTELLTDPGHTRGDLQLVTMAIRKGWVIPDSLLEHVPKILGAIVIKGKPKEQVAAALALVKMKEANDRAEGIDRPAVTQQPQQTTINVGVNVDNRIDERRSATLAIAERIRAGRVLPDTGPGGD